MTAKRRVFITAIGMVSPLGVSAAQTFDALIAGKHGVGHHPNPAIDRQVGYVRESIEMPQQAAQLRGADRVTLLAQHAAEQVFQHQPLEEAQQQQCGVFIGTGIGGVSSLCEAVEMHNDLAPRRAYLVVPTTMPNAATAQIAQRLKSTAEAQTYATACSAGAVAIGEAFRRIRDGYLDAAIAGGTESMMHPAIMAAWKQLHVLSHELAPDGSKGGCRPFSVGRSGFVLAEGAAMLMLETAEHAAARGATPIAEIIGYGTSNDGTHPLRPDDHGQSLAMSRCLADAGLRPEEVDYINAHATGTVVGDRIETSAIKRVFGDHAAKLAVSSIKAALGHTIGAAGALEAAITALSLQRRMLPPTLFYEAGDPVCDLDYVPGVGRAAPDLKVALSNSFGMGGNNAVLAFRAVT